MDLLNFVQRHIKTKVDFDGAYGAQCVDLFRQWCSEMGLPRSEPVSGAKDFAERYDKMPLLKKSFALLKGSRATAQPGDAAVWGATVANPYGHIAIVLFAEATGRLAVFEQDGFSQGGARLAWRDGKSAIGLLRPWGNI